MNFDVIRVILEATYDCRAAALTCTQWYNAYQETNIFRVWVKKDLAYVTTEMYPGVWRGSVYDLARAGNFAPIVALYDSVKHRHNMLVSLSVVVGLALMQNEIEFVDWAFPVVEDNFANIIGEYGNGKTLDKYTQYASLCIHPAVHADNIPVLLWLHQHEFTDHIIAYLNEYPQTITESVMQFAFENGLNIQADTDWVYKSVKMLQLCAQYGYNIPIPERYQINTIYTVGDFDVVVWLCNNTSVDSELQSITMNNIHDVILNTTGVSDVYISSLVKNTPPDAIMRNIKYETCQKIKLSLIQAACARKSAKMITWLLANKVTDEEIINEARNDQEDLTWMGNPILEAKIKLCTPGYVNHYCAMEKKFNKLCDTFGCDQARLLAANIIDSICTTTFIERGRWDLLVL